MAPGAGDESWHPIPCRDIGQVGALGAASLAQAMAMACCLQLSDSQTGLISCRVASELCLEGFPPVAWTKAMVFSRLSSPSGQEEPFILSIYIPLTCSLSLLNVVSPSQQPGDTSPRPAPKGVSRSHVREQ